MGYVDDEMRRWIEASVDPLYTITNTNNTNLMSCHAIKYYFIILLFIYYFVLFYNIFLMPRTRFYCWKKDLFHDCKNVFAVV